MKRNRAPKGFTLIELMIVVAIIGILAAIAIPNFIRYQLRSKEAEAKTVMGGIKTSEESFRGEYDNYVAAGPNPNALTNGGTTKGAWAVTPCNAQCNRQQVNQCVTYECIGYRPAGDVYFQYQTAIAAPPALPNYTSASSGDLDADGMANVWVFGTDNNNTGMIAVASPFACNPLVPVAQEVSKCDTTLF